MSSSFIFFIFFIFFRSFSSISLRLVLKRSQHHVTAVVFSRDSDVPVLTCSTQEWALKKQLSSTSSVAACRAVGDVLAQRCCEAGITRLFYREVPWTFRSDAVSLLSPWIIIIGRNVDSTLFFFLIQRYCDEFLSKQFDHDDETIFRKNSLV